MFLCNLIYIDDNYYGTDERIGEGKKFVLVQTVDYTSRDSF